MKTTIELPDSAFRQAKVLAAGRGMTLKQFFTEALEEKLRRSADKGSERTSDPPWMAGFGVLSDLADEHRVVLGAIEREFETVGPDEIG